MLFVLSCTDLRFVTRLIQFLVICFSLFPVWKDSFSATVRERRRWVCACRWEGGPCNISQHESTELLGQWDSAARDIGEFLGYGRPKGMNWLAHLSGMKIIICGAQSALCSLVCDSQSHFNHFMLADVGSFKS